MDGFIVALLDFWPFSYVRFQILYFISGNYGFDEGTPNFTNELNVYTHICIFTAMVLPFTPCRYNINQRSSYPVIQCHTKLMKF